MGKRGRDHLQDLDIEGGLLKKILNRVDERRWTVLAHDKAGSGLL